VQAASPGAWVVIALLFALLLVCMLLAWRGQKSASLVLFGIVVVMSAYWLKFHATDPLTIML
jgi:hypothetical protein